MRSELTAVTLALFAVGCGGGGTPPAPGTASGDSTKPTAGTTAKPAPAAGTRVAIDTAAAAGERPMLRETYTYEGSARDPFRPIVVAETRGPELPDLKLVGIIRDPGSNENTVVTFREIGSNRRYVWHPGDRFGRITVGTVTSTDVTLLEDDYGVVRRQTYSLRKTEDGN